MFNRLTLAAVSLAGFAAAGLGLFVFSQESEKKPIPTGAAPPDAIVNAVAKGQSGRDTLDFSNLTTAVLVDLQNLTVVGVVGSFTSIEEVIGTSQVDQILGPTGTVTWAISGAGSGVVKTFTFSGFEQLAAGTGAQTLSYASFTTLVSVNLQLGTATGFTAIGGFQNVTGGAGNDLLVAVVPGPFAQRQARVRRPFPPAVDSRLPALLAIFAPFHESNRYDVEFG